MYSVVDSDLDAAPVLEFPFIKGSKLKAVNCGIEEPAVQVNFEDFLPGQDIVWSMFHDEVQYVTSGGAEISFHLPPLMQESGRVVAEPGSIYLLPRDWRIEDVARHCASVRSCYSARSQCRARECNSDALRAGDE